MQKSKFNAIFLYVLLCITYSSIGFVHLCRGMEVTTAGGKDLTVHPLLFAIIGDHMESCTTSSTYEAWNANRPCSSCKMKRENFHNVDVDTRIPWRTEDETKRLRLQVRTLIRQGREQEAAKLQKKWSFHPVKVSVTYEVQLLSQGNSIS